MPAEPLRPATSNHPFLTHAARTVQYAALWRAAGKRAVERSEERLVVERISLSAGKASGNVKYFFRGST